MIIFRHAQIRSYLGHSFVIGYTSYYGVSIVSNVPTPHAAMSFYIIVVFYI